LDHLKNEEREEGFTEENDAGDFRYKIEAQFVAFELCEVSSVRNKCDEVDNERSEELVENGRVVSLPHEIDEDTDLRLGENFIVVCVGQSCDQCVGVVSGEDPVEVEDFGFNLPDCRVSWLLYLGFNFKGVLAWGIIFFFNNVFAKRVVGSIIEFFHYGFFLNRRLDEALKIFARKIGSGCCADEFFAFPFPL